MAAPFAAIRPGGGRWGRFHLPSPFRSGDVGDPKEGSWAGSIPLSVTHSLAGHAFPAHSVRATYLRHSRQL